MPDYYIRFRGTITGPFRETEVLSSWRSGKFTGLHDVSPDGVSWFPLAKAEVLRDSNGVEVIVDKSGADAIRAAHAEAGRRAAEAAAMQEAMKAADARAVAEARMARPPEPPNPVHAGPPAPYPQPPVNLAPTNGLAIAGFTCSLVGLCIGIAALPGLILSAIALSKPGGRGLAIAGLVLGILGGCLWLVWLVFWWTALLA